MPDLRTEVHGSMKVIRCVTCGKTFSDRRTALKHYGREHAKTYQEIDNKQSVDIRTGKIHNK